MPRDELGDVEHPRGRSRPALICRRGRRSRKASALSRFVLCCACKGVMRAIHTPVATLHGLYEAEYHGLLRLGWALTGSLASAEDLVQDVFVQAHRHWDHVASLDQPEAWLRRVLVNRARSRWRRLLVEARHRRVDETLVEMADVADEVWVAVRRLSRRQREVLAVGRECARAPRWGLAR
jgi:Sigma-70 region 2